MINVALFGLGTVGKGVLEIIRKNKLPINIIAVIDRSYAKKQDILQGIPASDDPNFALNNPNIQAIIEVMGGTSTALFIIREALDKKIPVITANKALLAEHGYALFNKAKENKTLILFEAAVAGAVPIIRSLNTIFKYEKITQLEGILNGTTNYMLTKMRTDKLSYSSILKQAQDLGFAEADPSFDVNGSDAAQKLALLSSLLSQSWIDWHKLPIKGIDNIELRDITWAENNNYRIRLVGNFLRKDNLIYAWLEPKMILRTHFLWDVELENNAIALLGEYSGPHLMVGKGAGSLPTAYSIITDILRLSEEPNQSLLFSKTLEYVPIGSVVDFKRSMYIRLQVEDEAGVLSKISNILSKKGISIASIFQEMDNKLAYLYIVTHACFQGDFDEVIAEIKNAQLACNDIVTISLEQSL